MNNQVIYKNMKNILFIILSFTMGGGAEALLTTIVNNLNPKKYNISIIEILHADIKVEPTNPNITILPYIMRADDPKRKEKMYYVYHEPEKVFREFIKENYDLYISFNSQRPSFLLPRGKKNIAWIHGDIYRFSKEKKPEEWMLQEKAFCNVNKIVSISDITTQSIKDLHPKHLDKIVEIYNGIDLDKIKKLAKLKTDVELKKPALLFSGRLQKEKAPLRLLEVFELVHKKKPNVHLYYMGFGTQSTEIIEEAQKKNLLEFIHLLGYQENPFPIITQCDITCLLSISEGFPMCLLESVALDKPFVSTVIGGARILANNGTCGKVIDTNEEAVKAICELLDDDKNELIKVCRESIRRFEIDGYIERIEKLIDSVVDENELVREI